MNKRLQYIVSAFLALMLSASLMAQTVSAPLGQDNKTGNEEVLSAEQRALNLEIESRLAKFMDDFKQLQVVGSFILVPDAKLEITKNFVNVLNQRLNTYNQRYNNLDVMWVTYTQAQQMDIANNEDLMKTVADIEQLKQTVKDTLDARSDMVKAVEDFANADHFIMSQVPVYKKLYKRAFQLSVVKKLAPQLEKAKAREALIFEKLQASYDAAKAATELVPSLQPRMNMLDEQFVVMKSVSEKVQALEYKPIIQCIKDYLFGLAAVAVIMLFVSLMIAKYKAYKDKIANLKKMDELMKKQGKDVQYPTI